jgi:predicted DNA-binding transcriptional regulator AlpA
MALNNAAKQGTDEKVSRKIVKLTRELAKLSSEKGGQILVDDWGPTPVPVVDYRIIDLQNKIDRLIRLKDVLELVPVSKSTWWAGVQSGRYPAAVRHLGSRITAWKLSEIMQLINREE